MPAIFQSDLAKGIIPLPYPVANEECVVRGYYTIPTTIAENDVVELAIVPAGCKLTDIVLDSDDLDSGTPAIVWDIGFMTGDAGAAVSSRTVGQTLFASSAVSQAGGLARPTLKTAQRDAGSHVARGVGAKLVTDAATAVEGVLGMTIRYAPI